MTRPLPELLAELLERVVEHPEEARALLRLLASQRRPETRRCQRPACARRKLARREGVEL